MVNATIDVFGYITKNSEIVATEGNVGLSPPPSELSEVTAARVKSNETLPVFATVIESEVGVSTTWVISTLGCLFWYQL